MNEALILPSDAMVSMSVFDFDTGPLGDYMESLTVPEYAYYKTPLRPSSGRAVTPTVNVDETTRTFRASAAGTSSDNPSDPLNLTDVQAARGVQFFFRSEDGAIDATYIVSYSGVGNCTGRNLMFAGDSSLCAPPPPMPPLPPPLSPPPSPVPP